MAANEPTKLTDEWCWEIAPGVQSKHTVCTTQQEGESATDFSKRHAEQVKADAEGDFPPVECN